MKAPRPRLKKVGGSLASRVTPKRLIFSPREKPRRWKWTKTNVLNAARSEEKTPALTADLVADLIRAPNSLGGLMEKTLAACERKAARPTVEVSGPEVENVPPVRRFNGVVSRNRGKL